LIAGFLRSGLQLTGFFFSIKSMAYSHWVENALDDPAKTWRVYYRCDDIWILQGGTWKLQSSKTYNMGFGTEAMFYGK
jgi:hypothetical protein